MNWIRSTVKSVKWEFGLSGQPTNYEDIMYRNKQRNDKKPLGGLTVTVRNGDVNGALRVLKKKLLKEGVFQELRELFIL